jgi:hypothetical protein
MEERGILRTGVAGELPSLAQALCTAGGQLVAGLGDGYLTPNLLHDLTLLTLGPQLRGGANVRRGTAAIRIAFEAIKEIISDSITSVQNNRISVVNAAKRTVAIEFAADPDIVIREQMGKGSVRQVVAIEVKGGTDFSNMHNRLGEAEKSHRNAKARGYAECWTVLNIDNFDLAMAKQESPTTDRFYRISQLVEASGPEYEDFRNRILSLVGI